MNGGIDIDSHLWWVNIKKKNLKRIRNKEMWGEIEDFNVVEEGIQLDYHNKDLDEEGQETIKWSFFQ